MHITRDKKTDAANTNATIVSSEQERLILVDSDDEIIGYDSKAVCHDGEGVLHRAFSVFLFNDAGELLLQQRSADKRLWPMYWSNSVCSHPREGESLQFATLRRMKEELGCESELQYLYKFQYQANFGELGSENELCSVFIGPTDGQLDINETEIADWRFIGIDALNRELTESTDSFTPWFQMEWTQLMTEYRGQIDELLRQIGN